MEAKEGWKRSMRIEEVDEDRRGSLPHSCRTDGRMDGTVGGGGRSRGLHPEVRELGMPRDGIPRALS